ncbi:proline-rich protein HaeIII subfamily 1-like [Onychomys torridus]|uniref:proline-rich protein HaeIII subfamily 1-like n=1 Tax=Onychomys torridus TaxID=38674 RepID=UPI00167F3EC6|nr:proline-rich protein HaeIII subfamily 1-like [Onychomys torridus]
MVFFSLHPNKGRETKRAHPPIIGPLPRWRRNPTSPRSRPGPGLPGKPSEGESPSSVRSHCARSGIRGPRDVAPPGCRPTRAIALPERVRGPRPRPRDTHPPPEAAREGDGPGQRVPQARAGGGGAACSRGRLVRAPLHRSLPAWPALGRPAGPGPGSLASPASMEGPPSGPQPPRTSSSGSPGASASSAAMSELSRWTNRPAQAAAAGEESEEAGAAAEAHPGDRARES